VEVLKQTSPNMALRPVPLQDKDLVNNTATEVLAFFTKSWAAKKLIETTIGDSDIGTRDEAVPETRFATGLNDNKFKVLPARALPFLLTDLFLLYSQVVFRMGTKI